MLAPVLFLCISQVLLTAANLPPPIERCKDDASLNECVMKQAPAVIKAFIKGIPKLGFPSFDPLHIPKIEQTEGGSKSISLNFTMKNMDIYGVDKAEMIKSEIDTSNKIIKLRFHIPQLEILSDYEASGRMLVVPMTGKGKAKITLEDVIGVFTFIYELVKKKGVEYCSHVPPSKLIVTPKNMKVHLDNLFNGDKTLGETTNKLLNENWKEAFDQLAPGIIDAIGQVFSLVTNNICKSIPYHEFLIKPAN